MQKIKSVLSGHKKSDDATAESHTSPTSGTHAADETHPIYDQMTGHGDTTTGAHPAASATSTSAGQTGAFGTHGAVSDTTRPGAGTLGKGNTAEGMSEASIKSGVIGFGRDGQEHAALPNRNNLAEDSLTKNQILGGGNTASGPTTANTSNQPSVLPPSEHNTRDQTGTGHTSGNIVPGNTSQQSSTQQPFEKNLRQESYTADTNRSFPLAGGVAPKQGTEHSSSSHHPTSTGVPSTSHHSATSSREPGTKEKEAGVRDGYGREGLAAAAAGAAALSTASAHSKGNTVQSQGLDTRQATHGAQPSAIPTVASTNNPSSGTTQNVHPEALAAARAAAGTSSTHGHGLGAHESSLGSTSTSDATIPAAQSENTGILGGARPANHRSASRPHIPGEFPSPTPDESKTFLYYRQDLVPEPGSDIPLTSGHHAAHDQTIAPTALAGTTATSSTTGPHSSDLLNKADPRVDSDRDGSTTAGTTASTAPSGQHELRHTGTLDEPRPRSSGNSEDHTARNAALAGGLAAGAAGVGYAASQKHDTHSNATDASSPYSSTAMDPRVLGNQSTLEEQRFDPQAKTAEPATLHTPQTSSPTGVTSNSVAAGHPSTAAATEDSPTNLTGPVHKSSLLNKLDPRVKEEKKEPESHHGRDAALVGAGAAAGVGAHHALQHDDTHKTDAGVYKKDTSGSPTRRTEPEHHHGRDAALVGGGAATGAGIHHTLQRNDTPGTGTAVLPQDSATSAPVGSSAHAPSAVPSSHTSTQPTTAASVNKNPDTYKGPLTTSGTPFYGTVGAPAPVESTKGTSAVAAHDNDSQHHHGRDAALVGGAAAGAGGLAYASQHDGKTDTGPASKTIGPHSSNVANVLDPRVKPDPSKQSHHTSGSTTEQRIQPESNKDHHYGRDAAVVGGTGAAGYGAYEAAKAYSDHRSTQPGASMVDQRYDPTASGARAGNPVPAAGRYDYNDPAITRNVNQPAVGHYDAAKDNTNRNAALGGTALGAGALGGAAYAASKHGDNSHQAATQPLGASSQSGPVVQQPAYGTVGHQTQQPTTGLYLTQGTTAPQTTHGAVPDASHNRYDSVQNPQDADHTKRNAALAGTAGIAAAGGAYAYSQHQGDERERARLEKEQQERLKKEQHDREKEQHKLDKEHHKQEKEAKKLEKEEHKHDKAIVAAAKEDKKHHKEEEKLEKERQKEAERLEKEREKEMEPEKKHGILGFLHRDKTKKEKRNSGSSSPRQSLDSNPRHSKEYAAGGAALGAGGAAAAAAAHDSDDSNSPRWKGKNRLQKDPPKGHPAREAQHDIELQGSKREHVGVDGPIGRPDAISGYQETRAGVYGAQPIGEIPESKKVIEPHTGLPMNIGRYGDGSGGTDASPTVVGHHGISGVDENLHSTHGTTDWDAIRKKDTAY